MESPIFEREVHQDSTKSSATSNHISFKTAAVVASAWVETQNPNESSVTRTDPNFTSKVCVIS